MEAVLFCIVICLQLAILCILAYGVRDYIRLKHLVRRLIMDCNELLLQVMEEERPADTASPPTAPIPIETVSSRDINHKRTRLAALAAGGQAKLTFKGHLVNTERVDTMTDTEVEEVYARYEARLGAMMTKSLDASLLRLNASAASILLPLPPERQLTRVTDLEKDPFVSSALSSACCELYFRYGVFLAPFTAALTTAKHCEWGHNHVEGLTPDSNENGGADTCTTSEGTPEAC